MIFVTCIMHVCLTIKYYKIMGGDKIVLLDGAGANGGGAATNGLLSMIPGMFANLIGGNKMDPNLVAALMNGRNNQDGFGGANGWWLWIIVLFWLWGGRGFDCFCVISATDSEYHRSITSYSRPGLPLLLSLPGLYLGTGIRRRLLQ